MTSIFTVDSWSYTPGTVFLADWSNSPADEAADILRHRVIGLDLTTGQTVCVARGGTCPAVARDDDYLWIISRFGEGSTVTRIDLLTGAVADVATVAASSEWLAPLRSHLALGGDALYALTAPLTLQTIDLATFAVSETQLTAFTSQLTLLRADGIAAGVHAITPEPLQATAIGVAPQVLACGTLGAIAQVVNGTTTTLSQVPLQPGEVISPERAAFSGSGAKMAVPFTAWNIQTMAPASAGIGVADTATGSWLGFIDCSSDPAWDVAFATPTDESTLVIETSSGSILVADADTATVTDTYPGVVQAGEGLVLT